MVRKSFRLGIQDITVHNSVSKAGVEYFEQLGIHPQFAEHYIRNYLSHINSQIQDNREVSVVEMYDFLDLMALKFKDCFELVLTRLGLDEMGSKEFRNDSCKI
jgi:hypothetical protein